QFLQDCLTAWGQTLPSNPDCSSVEGITCDSSGMVLEMKLPERNLRGPIPGSISSLRELSILDLSKNQLTGSIPSAIGILTNLQQLSLVVNQLNGTIPTAVGKLKKLGYLGLSSNQLSGAIPTAIGNLLNLNYLYLQYNQLTGSIPAAIGTLTNLIHLWLDHNKLTGSIPTEIGNLANLEGLNLYINQLTGSIPTAIGNLTNLGVIDLSSNQLTGTIPASLGNFADLTYLSLSVNLLSGTIPTTIGNLAKLKNLVLFENNLSGPIPLSIESLLYLEKLNLHTNNLSGTIPPSTGSLLYLQNLTTWGTNLTCPANETSCVTKQNPVTAFCRKCRSFCTTCLNTTSVSPTPPTPSAASPNTTSSSSGSSGGLPLAAIIGISVAAVLLLLLVAVLLYLRHKWQQKPTASATAGSFAALHSIETSLAEVESATNSWSAANRLGSGAFGDVYKGVSPRDGTTEWAVKRAKLIDVDFQREVQQMADKNHPNIVRLLGFAVGGDMRTRPEQVLIYEFVPNGDLERWLNPTKAPFTLTLPQRLGILIGAARGLEYLHSFDFVHRDIKPANILISADMQAKVADFGLVRVGEGTTVGSTRVMGTPGFVDPVYSRTNKATTATDVYSFGVLILVVLTGRTHIAETAEGGMHVLPWVEECLSKGDLTGLKSPGMDAPEEVLLRLTQLAISCTVARTANRPTMGDVANKLQVARNEVGGKEEVRAAVKVDTEDEERMGANNIHLGLDEELDLIHAVA
ncbi:unnamed protein product, partial [Closterium sp. NIES-53]